VIITVNPFDVEVGDPNTGVKAIPTIAFPVTVDVLLLLFTPESELVCVTVAD
jgi:hypothetical protein